MHQENLPIQAVERPRLAEQVAHKLELAIREGRFRPGERLPSERDLSDQFGVSRPVLREALKALLDESLVATRAGQGTFVRDLTAELARTPPPIWFEKNLPQVREFYEARAVVEPECAALAAERASEAQLVRLTALVDAAEEIVATGGAVGFTGLDIDFHECIAEMSGNHLLRKMLSTIIHPDNDLRRVLHLVPGHLPLAQARHRRILTAIRSHHPEDARAAMAEALFGTLRDVDNLLRHRKEAAGPVSP